MTAAARFATSTLAAAVGSGLLLALTACGGGEPGVPEAQFLAAEAVPFWDGDARAWVALDDADRLSAFGIELRGSALHGAGPDLPVGPLWLPRVPALGFDHAELQWHPSGHPPAGVFDRPHLDIRFFLADTAARAGFTDAAEAARVPRLEVLPPPYVPLPLFQPGTGAYWVDPTAPPFDGEPLAGTVALGFYGGVMVFVELKLDAALLASRGRASGRIAAPPQRSGSVAVPVRWAVDRGTGELRVTLEAPRRPP